MAKSEAIKDQKSVTRQLEKTMQRLSVDQVKSMFMEHIGIGMSWPLWSP